MMIRFDYARPLSLADVSIQLDRAMEAQQLAPWQWLSLDPIGDRTTSSSTGEIRDGIFHRPIRSNQGLLARAPFLLFACFFFTFFLAFVLSHLLVCVSRLARVNSTVSTLHRLIELRQ